jgi:hypothetical protein
LAFEPYAQSSDKKYHLNPAIAPSCLNIENISTERIQVIETFNNLDIMSHACNPSYLGGRSRKTTF